MWFRRLIIVLSVIFVLVGLGGDKLDGESMEESKEFSDITLDNVILKGLDAEGIKGLYTFVEKYDYLEDIRMGHRISGSRSDFRDKFDTDVVVDGDKRCEYYYKENVSLKYCDYLEEVVVKADDINTLYDIESDVNNYKTEELEYKDTKIKVTYLEVGLDKYVSEIRVSV